MKKVTLRNLIITAGYLEGIWLAVGINPGHEVLTRITGFLVQYKIDPLYIFFLNILPIVAFVFSMYLIYRKGRKLGFVAVGLAFFAGLQVLTNIVSSLILLLVSFAIGWVAKRKS